MRHADAADDLGPREAPVPVSQASKGPASDTTPRDHAGAFVSRALLAAVLALGYVADTLAGEPDTTVVELKRPRPTASAPT